MGALKIRAHQLFESLGASRHARMYKPDGDDPMDITRISKSRILPGEVLAKKTEHELSIDRSGKFASDFCISFAQTEWSWDHLNLQP